MSSGVRVSRAEYEGIPLRAHSLLEGVPLHDVWALDLVGEHPERNVLFLRDILSLERLAESNLAVNLLFRLRGLLGALFRLDAEPAGKRSSSFLARSSDRERSASLIEPGTREGPFEVLFASQREVVSEIRNATVHAFSVYALLERAGGRRLYWAIYVQPVGRITGFYMALIDPFRRWVVYPAALRYVERAWRKGASLTGPKP